MLLPRTDAIPQNKAVRIWLDLVGCSAGVRLRNNKEAGPFPDEEDDTDLPFFEAQLCAAQADPDDELLKVLALYMCSETCCPAHL